jgi:hypothetical protein
LIVTDQWQLFTTHFYPLQQTLKAQIQHKIAIPYTRMPSNKKPRKTYRPKRILHNPVAWVVNGVKPASVDAQTKLKLGYHWSMTNLTKGDGTTHDWQTVSDALNVAMVLCEMDYGKDYLPELEVAMYSMLDMRDRYRATGRLLFKGQEMQAVNLGLELHDEQIAIAPLGVMENALNEVKRRLAKGFFVKREASASVQPQSS